MTRRILVINGHPDARPERLAAALAGAYIRGASGAGHQIRRLDVGAIDFPLIRRQAEFLDAAPPAIREAQEAIAWAEHLVVIFPLWLGGAPALLKGFLEQVFRYGFAVSPPGEAVRGLLKGRSARLVVTMGMPAIAFRWVFGAFGVRSLERGLLWVSGVGPIRRSILGEVAGSPSRRAKWLQDMYALGQSAL
jgi:putative NADPH-quinone reductase